MTARHTTTALATRADIAIGYIRVSTAEQGKSGLGLASQRAAIRAECKRRGWTLVDIHTDVASGKTRAHRPGLAAALDAVGGDDAVAGNLVVAKLDRLSRSLLDFASIMDQSQRQGWGMIVMDMGVDTRTATGELLVGVLALFAQWERRMISERTSAALQAAKAKGAVLGRAHTVGADVRQTIIERRAAGDSYHAIAATFNDMGIPTGQGGKRWYPSTVQAVEKRPR